VVETEKLILLLEKYRTFLISIVPQIVALGQATLNFLNFFGNGRLCHHWYIL